VYQPILHRLIIGQDAFIYDGATRIPTAQPSDDNSLQYYMQPLPWDSKEKEIFATLDDICIANKKNP
jgi:hypothetical protein